MLWMPLKAAQAHDGPYLLDFQVEEFTNVYPMVAPAKSNADMIRRPLPLMEGENNVNKTSERHTYHCLGRR